MAITPSGLKLAGGRRCRQTASSPSRKLSPLKRPFPGAGTLRAELERAVQEAYEAAGKAKASAKQLTRQLRRDSSSDLRPQLHGFEGFRSAAVSVEPDHLAVVKGGDLPDRRSIAMPELEPCPAILTSARTLSPGQLSA